MKTNIKSTLNGLKSYALCSSKLSKIKGGDTEVIPINYNFVVEDTIDL